MKQNAQHRWVNRHTLAWLLFAQAVAIMPLFWSLPKWVPALWFAALLWRVQIYRGAWSFPSNTLKLVLGLVSIAGLVISYAGAVGVEPLVAFLVVSFVLKLLEVRSRNDVLLVIYVGFITVAAQFLFHQTIFMAIYGSLSVFSLLCAWNCVYRSRSPSLKKQLAASLMLFAQSLPLMLLLFVILPRAGTLWHVPIPQSTGVTGFSDSMAPGDFTSLSQSREVAFRVSFASEDNNVKLPPRSDWYWRGLVLDEFDGRRWRHRENPFFRRSASGRGAPDFWQLAVNDKAPNIRYEVLLEPHQQRWLFTLMVPLSVYSTASKIFFTHNFLAESAQPVASRTQYHVVSSADYMASPLVLEQSVQRRNLRLPGNYNPRARDLARRWLEQGLEAREIVASALDLFNASFTYTLQPPPLGAHSVDEFLFITRRGFCEHFASSFVVLMRAAGVPARVVVGYQGGEFNAIENYIIVRQADAHAWAEVWLPNRGWVRVDPTAAVSPLRIEQGLEQSLAADEQRLVRGFFSVGFVNYLQLRLDAFNYSWQRWVLGYNAEKQAGLFRRLLGGAEVWRIAVIFVGSAFVILSLYFLTLTWRVRTYFEYPEQAVYVAFIGRLRRYGYAPHTGETPLAFAKRVGNSKQEWSAPLLDIAVLYNRVAYENQPALIVQLKQKTRAFRFN